MLVITEVVYINGGGGGWGYFDSYSCIVNTVPLSYQMAERTDMVNINNTQLT